MLSATTTPPLRTMLFFSRKSRSGRYSSISWSKKTKSKGPVSLREDTPPYMSWSTTVTLATPEWARIFLAISASRLLISSVTILAPGYKALWASTKAEYPQQVPTYSNFLGRYCWTTFSTMRLFSGPMLIIQLIYEYLSMHSKVRWGWFLGHFSRMYLSSPYYTASWLLADSLGWALGGRQNSRLSVKYYPLLANGYGGRGRGGLAKVSYLASLIQYYYQISLGDNGLIQLSQNQRSGTDQIEDYISE